MPVKQTIPYSHGIFFITFTCHKWLNLIEIANAYEPIYKWFDLIKSCGHYINGYVIMPNHVHMIVSFTETNQSINTIIGNGKRFIAYEIIKRLTRMNEKGLLNKLAADVKAKRNQNKKHAVWNVSFDWKDCRSNAYIDQKLEYIHNNPCAGKWQLSNKPVEYEHSSAKFYNEGIQGKYHVTNIGEMEDIDFVKKKTQRCMRETLL